LPRKGWNLFRFQQRRIPNLEKVLWKAYECLQQAPKEEPEEEIPVYRAEENPRAFTISREGDTWIVSGK